MKNLCITLYFLFVTQLIACSDAPTEEQIKGEKYTHEVEFFHPGSKSDRNEKNTLYEWVLINEQQKLTRLYSMDVSSVFCGEDVCKVDRVKLFWDELGQYKSYSLADGVSLEKGNGLDFDAEDYRKLDIILSKKNSGLKGLNKTELVQPQSSGNGADALTGATIALDKTDYIEEAIWTCYTLWHFANGDISQIIQNITGQKTSSIQLKQLLINGDKYAQSFALGQLIRREYVDEEMLAILLVKGNLPEHFHNAQIIEYINTLPTDELLNFTQHLLHSKNERLRFMVMKNVVDSPTILSQDFYSTLVTHLINEASYQGVNYFIEHLKRLSSADTIHQSIDLSLIYQSLLPLLMHDNFTISRRVYWFLHDKLVTNSQVDAFYQLHKNNL